MTIHTPPPLYLYSTTPQRKPNEKYFHLNVQSSKKVTENTKNAQR
jgi:hypothetical protein